MIGIKKFKDGRELVIDDLQSEGPSTSINDQKKSEELVLRDQFLTIKKEIFLNKFQYHLVPVKQL